MAFLVLAALLGACIGSFCNVLIIRMKDGRSLGGRSACGACQRTLTPQDLIPIVSWVVLRGKCRTCQVPVHVQYPLVEAAGALIGIYAVARGGDVAFTATFLFTLLVIAVFDLRWQLVPTTFVLVMGGLFAAWQALAVMSLVPVLLSVLVSGGFLGALVWGSKGRGMGEGDPIVGAAVGAALPWPLGPIALVGAFIIGGIVAVGLLATKKVQRKTAIPFVPFLALSAVIVYAYGEVIHSWLAYAFA